MKKLSILFLSLALIAGFTTPGFAQLRKDLATVKGIVVYINSSRTEITVKDVATGKEVTFTSPGVPAGIMNGNPVVVLYKKGTTNATTVRLVGGKKATAMATAPVAPVTYQAPKPAATTSATTAPAKSKYGW